MTRMLLIGAAGLDWARFQRLDGGGAMPRLSALRERGLAGWLTGAVATGDLAAWSSLITGRQPEAHGVWRGAEAWAGGVRPVSRASWREPPLWARLATAGVSTGSVAWSAARPGEAWDGVHIDEDAIAPSSRDPTDWALPLHALPAWARDAVRGRRVHPSQITGAMLAPLVPDLAAIDQERDLDLPTLAVAMARAATIQGFAAWMLQEPAPDAVFVHFPWLATLDRAFGARRDGPFAGVGKAAARFLDGLIGRLADLAGPDVLMLVAAPGPGDRPGCLIAGGPGVTPDGEFEGAHLLDLAPTVLARFGLADAGLPGRRIAAIAAEPGIAPAPRPRPRAPPPPDPAMIRAIREAGYRPPARPGPAWRAQGLAELAFLMLERAPGDAGEMAGIALKEDPDNILALRVRVRAHVALGEAAPLSALAEALLRAAPNRGWGALAWGAHHLIDRHVALAAPWLEKAESDPEPGTLLTVAALWLAAGRGPSAERVFRGVLAMSPGDATAELGLAMAALARRDFIGAEQALGRASLSDPSRPAIFLQYAQLYARTARKLEARWAADVAVRLGAPANLADAAAAGRLG